MVDQAQLIAQFSQGYLAARQYAAAGDRRNALAAYQQLLVVYRQMEASGMEMLHREFAHDQLTQLYAALSNKPAPAASQAVAAQQASQVAAAAIPQSSAPSFQPQLSQQPAPAWQMPPAQSVPASQVAPASASSSQQFPSQQAPAAPPWMTVPSQEVPPAFAAPVFAPPGSGVSSPAVPSYNGVPAAKAVKAPQSFLAGFSSKELLLMGSLVLLIGIVVFVKPEVIGLATLENIGITVPVDTTFKTGGPLTLTLAENPTSLRISGQIVGSGRAKVWLVMPTGRKLVFDSGLQYLQSDGDGAVFTAACLDTCFLEGVSKDITLEVELDNAELTIDSVTYTRKGATNSPPTFIAASDTVGIVAGQPTAIDLTQFFADADGDALTFIAGNAPGVTVDVSGSTLTVTSESRGTQSIPVVATDGLDVARVQLQLLVR